VLVVLGNDIHTELFNYACHGAYVSGHAYMLVATATAQPFVFPPEIDTFVPFSRSADSTVAPTFRVNSFSPDRMMVPVGDFSAKKVGTVTRGASACTSGLYDPEHPVPAFSAVYTFNNSKGSQWVLDTLGARQWSRDEEASLYQFDDTAKAFLLTMSEDKALAYEAGSLPVAPLVEMYKEVFQCLQSADMTTFRPTESKAVEYEDYHKVLTVAISAVMPTVDELRELQREDPDIQEVLRYHEQDCSADALPAGVYGREAPYTHVEDGIVYYRALVGSDENLVHSVLLPKVLIPKVMEALHDSAIYAHPGERATRQVVREHCY
jgi:hypothetical protein